MIISIFYIVIWVCSALNLLVDFEDEDSVQKCLNEQIPCLSDEPELSTHSNLMLRMLDSKQVILCNKLFVYTVSYVQTECYSCTMQQKPFSNCMSTQYWIYYIILFDHTLKKNSFCGLINLSTQYKTKKNIIVSKFFPVHIDFKSLKIKSLSQCAI